MEENKIELHDMLDTNEDGNIWKQDNGIEEVELLPREEVIAKLEERQQQFKKQYEELLKR